MLNTYLPSYDPHFLYEFLNSRSYTNSFLGTFFYPSCSSVSYENALNDYISITTSSATEAM